MEHSGALTLVCDIQVSRRRNPGVLPDVDGLTSQSTAPSFTIHQQETGRDVCTETVRTIKELAG